MQNPTQLTDTTTLPAGHVKPQEGGLQQPASQHSTMQSVSMGEVTTHEPTEAILGSVASITDHMQPGSFMSPISDRKSGSLEHLSGEEKTTSTEPNAFTQGVEAVKEGAANFGHTVVEKIEEFVHTVQEFAHTAADKIAELAKDLTTDTHKTEAPKAPEGLTETVQQGAHELKENILKRSYLVRKSVSKRLGKKSDVLKMDLGLGAGVAKVYARQQYKNLRRKAARFGRNLNRTQKANSHELKSKGLKFQRDFNEELSKAGSTLRQRASDLRSRARSVLNELPRNFESAKNSAIKTVEQQISGSKPETTSTPKWTLEYSATEWNGTTGKPRTQPLKKQTTEGQGSEGKPTEWTLEISSHEWNESQSNTSRQARYLLSRAQNFMKRASRQSGYAQRRLQAHSGSWSSSARSFIKRTVQKGESVQSMVSGQVDQMINSVTQRLGDSTHPSHGHELKETTQSWLNRASEKGHELLGDLDEAKDAAKRKLIEKKAELQYQAELLTTDKFPTQEALDRKEAINSEIRNLHGKENTSQ